MLEFPMTAEAGFIIKWFQNPVQFSTETLSAISTIKRIHGFYTKNLGKQTLILCSSRKRPLQCKIIFSCYINECDYPDVLETATTSSVESSYNNLALRIYASDSSKYSE